MWDGLVLMASNRGWNNSLLNICEKWFNDSSLNVSFQVQWPFWDFRKTFFSLLRCNSSLFLQTLMTVLTTHVLMVRRAWMVTTTTRAVAFLGLLENDVELVRSSNDWNILFGMKSIFSFDHVAVALLFCLLMLIQLSSTQVCNGIIRPFLLVKVVNHSILLRKLEHHGIPGVIDF